MFKRIMEVENLPDDECVAFDQYGYLHIGYFERQEDGTFYFNGRGDTKVFDIVCYIQTKILQDIAKAQGLLK